MDIWQCSLNILLPAPQTHFAWDLRSLSLLLSDKRWSAGILCGDDATLGLEHNFGWVPEHFNWLPGENPGFVYSLKKNRNVQPSDRITKISGKIVRLKKRKRENLLLKKNDISSLWAKRGLIIRWSIHLFNWHLLNAGPSASENVED